MRRLLCLVALTATLWPHIVAMSCPESSPTSYAERLSVVAEHVHEGPGCLALMACSSTMLESMSGSAVSELASPPMRHVKAAATTAVGTVPPTDPPPPRRVA